MAKVTVSPRRLQRVARVFLSKKDYGLNSFEPVGDLFLYVFYDPLTQLYFTGSQTEVYMYYYTNDFNMAVNYLIEQWRKHFILFDELQTAFGDKAAEVSEKHHTLKTLSQFSGTTDKTIVDAFVDKVKPSQLSIKMLTLKDKTTREKGYCISAYHPQVSMINLT